MIKRVFNAIGSSLRDLVRRWGALLILLVLYIAMLGAIYLFFVTREATIGQLILSLALALAAPILFLVIQTMAARYSAAGNDRALPLLGGSLRDFWKLLVISLPLIILAVLAVYLFSKFGSTAPVTTVREAVRTAPAPLRPAPPKLQPVHWQSVALTTLQYLLFLLMFPLAAIHLWCATARDGLKQTFKRSARIIGTGLLPQAVATYAIGFIFFAVVPYLLVVTRTSAASAWLDITLLISRLALAVLFSLIGWVVTVAALARLSTGGGLENVAQAGESSGHVPAEA